jgi:hypothetical protein
MKRVESVIRHLSTGEDVVITAAESAFTFIEQLTAVAERFAKRGFAVVTLRCEWGHFGSWLLEVQDGRATDAYVEALLAQQWKTAGPDVTRFSFDGREGRLQIEKAPTKPLTSPGPWRGQTAIAFKDGTDAIKYVDTYIDSMANESNTSL